MVRQNRAYKKGAPFRDASLKVIVGEGMAEIQYFAKLLSQRVRFFPLPYNDDGRSSPEHIISKARHFVDELQKGTYDFKRYDELWVLIDVDAWTAKLPSVAKMCQDFGYRLAISNPCFEIWLLFHLNEFNPQELLPTGRKAPEACEALLKRILGGYKKTNLNMSHFQTISLAFERAKKADDPKMLYPPAPGTHVYRIFENMDLSYIRHKG